MIYSGMDQAETDARLRVEMDTELARQGISKVELAERVGMSRQQLHHVLSGDRGKIPNTLLRVLDGLGLELCVRRKE